MRARNRVKPERTAEIIRSRFESLKKANPLYSLRAFAKDLDVSPAVISLVFAGKRAPSEILQLKFERKFGTPKGVVDRSKRPAAGAYASPSFVSVDMRNGPRHWYELAILDLLTVDGFVPDVAWISRRIGISAVRASEALDALAGLGLLEIDGEEIRKTKTKISFTPSTSLPIVRSIHRQFIQKALEELERHDQSAFDRRRISGTTMAVNPARLDEAKRRVDAFQQELTDFLTEGRCTELYQINVQFFPLTAFTS